MIIRIKNLKLNAIIGLNDWERNRLQPIIINIVMTVDESKVVMSDSIEDTVDYKAMKKSIIQAVLESRFLLLETLSRHILDMIMTNPKVIKAVVEIDKPGALRFADSVSIECSAQR